MPRGAASDGLDPIEILSTVYNFTDEQVAAACKLTFKGVDFAGGGLETPAIVAEYRIDSKESAGTAEFTIIFTDNKVLPSKTDDETKRKKLEGFIIESLTKEQKAKRAKTAEGF